MHPMCYWLQVYAISKRSRQALSITCSMYSIIFASIVISEIPEVKVILGGLIIVGILVYESIRVRLNNKT